MGKWWDYNAVRFMGNPGEEALFRKLFFCRAYAILTQTERTNSMRCT